MLEESQKQNRRNLYFKGAQLIVFAVLFVLLCDVKSVYAKNGDRGLDRTGQWYYRIINESKRTVAIGPKDYLENVWDEEEQEFYDGLYRDSSLKGTVTIPGTVTVEGKSYTVTEVAPCAFCSFDKITKIVIPASCTKIEEGAFEDCFGLETVSFLGKSKLQRIELNAFSSCQKLKSITIPGSCTKIGESAFWECSALKTVSFAGKSKLQRIEGDAFRFCDRLESITIPAGCTEIGEGAFCGCEKLKKVAFAEKSKLQKIGECAFENCMCLKSVTIPASCTQIETEAFCDDDKLEKITFASGSRLKSIGEMAFDFCIKLKSVTIPAGCSEIGDRAFFCAGLEKITFASGSKLKSIGKIAFYGCDLKNITIPASCTTIGKYAFLSCEDLSEITINASSIKLGKGAFWVYGEFCGDWEEDSNVDENSKFAGSIYVENKAVYNAVKSNGVPVDSIICKRYTIHYSGKVPVTRTNGKTEIKSFTHSQKNISYQSRITLSYTPPQGYPRAGYSLCWNTRADGRGEEYQVGGSYSGLTKTGELKLYAVWKEKLYDICYILNDPNTASYGSILPQLDIRYTENVELRNMEYNISGYSFTGWNTKRDGSGKSYAAGGVYSRLTEKGTIYLYAQWSRRTQTILFDANGGIGSMQKQQIGWGKEEKLRSVTFTYPGKKFVEWNTQPDGSGDSYGNEALFQGRASDAVTLFAIWKTVSYTVHFDGNGGVGTMGDVTVCEGDSQKGFAINWFVKTGYVFSGWSLTREMTEDGIYTVGPEGMTGGSLYELAEEETADTGKTEITLYAIWSVDTYVVQFRGNGGTGRMSDVSFEAGREAALPACSFTRKGYTFQGWSQEAASEEVSLKDQEKIIRSIQEGNLVLYAQWAPNTYTVVYDANGGSGTMRQSAFCYDEEDWLRKNRYQKSGCEFAGWNTRPDGGGTDYADEESVENLTDKADTVVTLYAQWEYREIQLTLDANGGEASRTSKKVQYGDKCGTLPIPKRDAYQFLGWYTRKNGGTVYTESTVVECVNDITLYARWKGIGNKVIFNATGGTCRTTERSVWTGEAVGSLPRAERQDYIFAGWYTAKTGGKQISASTVVEGNVTYYARWEPGTTGTVLVYLQVQSMKKADGYVIEYSRNKNFSGKKSIQRKSGKIGRSITERVQNLDRGKNYYFRARCYVTKKNGKRKYGQYSFVKKIRVAKE